MMRTPLPATVTTADVTKSQVSTEDENQDVVVFFSFRIRLSSNWTVAKCSR